MNEHPDNEVTREEIHYRSIDFRGYKRSDGLLEVVAGLVDRKSHDFAPPGGGRLTTAGEPIHDHGVRVVFGDDMVIREISTSINAYPYRECNGGGASLQALVGLRIGAGWNSEVRKRLPNGDTCTHLKELMTPLASAALQLAFSFRKELNPARDANGRPLKIDSCYAYGAERELVRIHWPEFHEKTPA